MIVDIHVHLMSMETNGATFWNNFVDLLCSLSGRPPEKIRRRLPEFWDNTGDMLVKEMDAAGIDKAVILAIDFGLAKGLSDAILSPAGINKLYADAAKKYPSRLIPFFGVDPRREGAVQLFEMAVKEWGMKGLKLLPPTGFYPNDKNCYALYAKCVEFGVPVLVHCGPEVFPLESKYAYPIFLDEVPNAFPQLKIIIAHAGYCWWPEAVTIASNRPNIFLDISAWQPRRRSKLCLYEFYVPLRSMLNTIGASRLLWGTDWPGLKLFMPAADWIKALKEPPEEIKAAGIEFTEEEVKAILGGNAAKLLGLESS